LRCPQPLSSLAYLKEKKSDLNDQVLGRDDFSPFSSFDEDQKRESSDSLTIMHDADGLPYTATSDEVMDTAIEGSSQQQISPEISEAVKHKHLMELEAQLHFTIQWQSSKRKILMI
jgi:hypothetical protein